MKNLIIWFVKTAARIHDRITGYRDDNSFDVNDKQLHFIVFMIFTLVLFFAVQGVFRLIAGKMVTAIAWIYTVTLDVGIMFAVEVGQGLTRTGDMELGDVVYGMWGMLAAVGVYVLFRCIIAFFGLLRTDPNENYRNYSGGRY